MKHLLILIGSLALASGLYSAEKPPYAEGPVVEVSYVRTKPGMFDAYLKWVNSDRKALYDEYKKAGLIVSFNVYASVPRSPSDPDVILTVTYPNMAALDNMDEKTASIDEKVAGTRTKQNDAAVDREKMRTLIGSQLIRELLPN